MISKFRLSKVLSRCYMISKFRLSKVLWSYDDLSFSASIITLVAIIHFGVSLQGSRSAALCLHFGQSLIVQVSSFFGICKISLSLTKLSQVQGSDLFGFFNLLLVTLNFSLEGINQSLHAFMVLTIFVPSKSKFLNTALRASQVLISVSHAAAFGIQFRLKLPNTGFHLIHSFLSSLKGISFGSIQTGLQVLGLAFE